MNRLMILGSMDEFIELVQCAKKRGYYTIVCDGYENGPAKEYADKVYNVNIKDVDTVAEICKKEQVNGIIASFSDVLFEYLTLIAHKAGIKTYCTPEKMPYLRSKTLMKEMFRELGVPVPASRVISRKDMEQDIVGIEFPVVIKPVDGYGSRGIYIVEDQKEIEAHFQETAGYSNYPDQIIVEEYNKGYEFNMMNWIIDGEVHTISIADREKSVEVKGDIPHVSRVAYPSRLSRKVYEEAKEIIKKVAEYTGIKTGPLSMQFFWSEKTGVQVCECAGRFFGYEHELVTLGSGLSIEELLLDYVYDEDSMKKRLEDHSPFYKNIAAGLYFHGYEGTIADMSSVEDIIHMPEVVDSIVFYKEQECISHSVGAKPYVVRLYIKGKNYEELDETTKRIFERMKVFDKNGRNLIYHNQVMKY